MDALPLWDPGMTPRFLPKVYEANDYNFVGDIFVIILGKNKSHVFQS